ncbi:MAG: cobalamin biosynthesis protein CobD [Desulfobulbus propionicus]|nr:MAG: cobalamin biosynthesis protein CobD [Desulfobulbus propionicus]
MLTPSWLYLLVLPLGYGLDRLVGDPRWLPHPIRWMGQAIVFFEPFFRRLIKDEKLAGLLFAVSLISCCWLICAGTLVVAGRIHPVFALAFEAVMIFYALATRSLVEAARSIFDLLGAGNVDQAREEVAMIVGRDVQSYQADDISRATVETVAENFVDGIFSPLFFIALGGGPLALTYKMVNTLDSMVGYKNQRYLYFGRAAARIDDVANFIPARLSVLCIAGAARLLKMTHTLALATAKAEGTHHSSPNAGFPEAAFAGALQVRLNGPNYYGGQLVEKPYIGVHFEPPQAAHINQACKLTTRASEIGAVACFLVIVLRSILF